jgi:predicted acetyltransferase
VLADVRVRFATIKGVEVVPVVEHVDAEFLGVCCGTPDVVIACVLWVELDGDAYIWHLRLLGSGHLTITPTSSHDDGGYPPAMDSITYRPVTDDEYPAFARALIEGFSDDIPDEELTDLIKSTLPAQRTLAAFDGDEIVGTFGGYDVDLTVPGGHVAMEGTTVVTVFPTHRRMGLMSEMMSRHLENSVANGYSIAGLWASASNIYGRYGFGVASYAHTVTMRARDIVFRDGIDIDRVRRISVEDAHEVLPRVFDRVLPTTPGMYARSAVWWKADVLQDADWTKQGKTSKRIVIHEGSDGPDGYAIYRQQSGESDDGHANGTVHIVEIIAATERAHASLWSYLTNVDGCPNIRSWNTRVDDPLPMKLVEPRRIKLESHFDALWILILDVVAALEARSYEHDGTIRFTVAGSFRPDVRGSYELSVENGVGSCTRIEDEGELALDIDVLGALYLGGCDTSAYASAGRVRGDTASIGRLHELFRTARSPWCNQVF